MLKGKKLGGLLPPSGEGGPEAIVVSDEDEAAEMEDEAVRSRVQHTPKVRGEAVGGGHPWALPHPHPPSPGGVVALSQFSVAATQTLCALSVSVSLSLCLCVWVSGSLSAHCPHL